MNYLDFMLSDTFNVIWSLYHLFARNSNSGNGIFIPLGRNSWNLCRSGAISILRFNDRYLEVSVPFP